MSLPIRYVIDPSAPFPKRWRDAHGQLTVMAGPTKGYVMVRRPRGAPFVLHVRELTNEKPHSNLGPFRVVEDTARPVPTSGGGSDDG